MAASRRMAGPADVAKLQRSWGSAVEIDFTPAICRIGAGDGDRAALGAGHGERSIHDQVRATAPSAAKSGAIHQNMGARRNGQDGTWGNGHIIRNVDDSAPCFAAGQSAGFGRHGRHEAEAGDGSGGGETIHRARDGEVSWIHRSAAHGHGGDLAVQALVGAQGIVMDFNGDSVITIDQSGYGQIYFQPGCFLGVGNGTGGTRRP